MGLCGLCSYGSTLTFPSLALKKSWLPSVMETHFINAVKLGSVESFTLFREGIALIYSIRLDCWIFFCPLLPQWDDFLRLGGYLPIPVIGFFSFTLIARVKKENGDFWYRKKTRKAVGLKPLTIFFLHSLETLDFSFSSIPCGSFQLSNGSCSPNTSFSLKPPPWKPRKHWGNSGV